MDLDILFFTSKKLHLLGISRTLLLLFLLFSMLSYSKPTDVDSLFKKVEFYSYSDSSRLFFYGSLLHDKLKENENSVLEARLFKFYGNYFSHYEKFKAANYYYSLADSILHIHNNDSLKTELAVSIGYYLLDQDSLIAAEDSFSKSYKQAVKQNDTINQINSLRGLAFVHLKEGKKEKSLELYLQALELAKQSRNKPQQAKLFQNIGLLKRYVNKIEESQVDFYKALALIPSQGYDRDISVICNGLASVYDQLNMLDSAVYFYQQSLFYANRSQDFKTVAMGLTNLAYTYFRNRNFVTAKQYADSAYRLVSLKQIMFAKPVIFMCLSDISYQHNELEAALQYADSAEKNIKNIATHTYDIAAVYLLKSDIYAAKSDYRNAYRFEKKYNLFRDSINEVETRKKVEELQIRYQSVVKENELLEHQHKVKSLKEELAKREVYQKQMIFIGSITFLGIILIILFLIFRYKLKSHHLFANRLIQNVEEERSRIAKDLHDSIGISIVILKNKFLKKFSEKTDALDFISEVNDLVDKTRKLSQELYPAHIEDTHLKEIFTQFFKKIEKETSFLCVMDFQLRDMVINTKNKSHIFRIVQECVSNTLKHSEADTIHLTLSELKQGGIRMIYKDNGKGMVDNGKADGIGMLIIKERTKILHGSLEVHHNSMLGVKIIFTFYPK